VKNRYFVSSAIFVMVSACSTPNIPMSKVIKLSEETSVDIVVRSIDRGFLTCGFEKKEMVESTANQGTYHTFLYGKVNSARGIIGISVERDKIRGFNFILYMEPSRSILEGFSTEAEDKFSCVKKQLQENSNR